MALEKDISALYNKNDLSVKDLKRAEEVFKELLKLLNKGKVRSAEFINGSWQANSWVKQGILLGFRITRNSVILINIP